MPYIQANKLLPPTSRVIRPYNCSMICVEGPNIMGKLNLSGVEIPYDSQFTTRMTLNPGATKQPLYYGFLGADVTFVLLKFTFDETDPRCNIEEEQFVTYYFEDQPSIVRYANKLLLLTGNSVHRIPQIFLGNPSEVKVTVEAMVANLEQDDIEAGVVNITNLYYNSVISDKIYIVNTDLSTGFTSTQLQVINVDGDVVLYLDYSKILTIEPQYDTYELKITTDSDSIIILGFLSLFEMYQAYSRISWVRKTENPTNHISTRWLTRDEPPVDLLPPDITLNSGVTPISLNTYVWPSYVSGTTILPMDIINYFISGITDTRDGDISVSLNSVNIIIRQYGYIEPLSAITHIGVYDIIMIVVDIANNQRMIDYTIICDDESPQIIFKPVASGTTFTMTDVDMSLPSVGITPADIIRKSVDHVYDAVDGTIANSAITMLIYDTISGYTGFTAITIPNTYSILYRVYDSAGNFELTGKTLVYSGVTIIGSGDTITVGPLVTSIDFRYGGATGTTAIIVLSGISFLIANSSGNTFIWDSDNAHGTYHDFGTGSTGIIFVTVLGTIFTITFTRGSLLFTITNQSVLTPYFSVSPLTLTHSFETGLTEFVITTNREWSLTESIDWIEFDSSIGTGTTVITGTIISGNTTFYSRSGLTAVSGYTGTTNVAITQESNPDYFTVTPSALTYSYESGLVDIFDITTNLHWSVSGSPVWVDLSTPSGGTGSETMIVTTNSENTTGSPRSGLISIIATTVENGTVTISVTITQEST